MQIFRTSLDRTAQLISFFITLIFIIVILSVWHSSGNSKYVAISLSVLVYLFCFLLRPIDYRIGLGKLTIHRLASDVEIPFKNISAAGVVDKDIISWSSRKFGVGGLFGYFGKFYNEKIGNMVWYATRTDRAVLIRTNSGENIVLTPDDPAAFIKALNLHSIMDAL